MLSFRSPWLVAVVVAWLLPDASAARPFSVGEVDGVLDVSLGYGLLARVESRDEWQVGIGNGGLASSVNGDDGNLNYDVGIVANQLRGTADLALRWKNFGAVVRAYGFYDFENELGRRSHLPLSDDALWLVGSGAELQDAYLTANFTVEGVPLAFRVGQQVVNWGESGFLRFGADVVNPIDVVSLFQPTSTARDLFVRQGMLWGAANVTEEVSIEAFYQYDWEPVVSAPVGWIFSEADLIGGAGVNAAFEGFGRFSDRGTNLDDAFGLPAGTLGFDPDFMKIYSLGEFEPDSQGQFGFSVQAFVPALNASKLALHFMNYHGRFPIISGVTAGPAAVAQTTQAAVDARAQELSDRTGLPIAETLPIAQTLTIGEFANATRYLAAYPDNIQMLGFSFNTATINTGTLLAGEVSHHFGWVVQQPVEEVLAASLSPIEFTNPATQIFKSTSLGVFGPNQGVPGSIQADKTQLAFAIAQLFGPRLGAAQTLLSFDVGWVHIHDLPPGFPFDADSWGYRIAGQLTYDGVFGAFSLRPLVLFTHDVNGLTPGPAGAFREGRKSFTAALDVEYTKTWTVSLSYTSFFDGKPYNPLHDRDFVRFNVIFHY